MNVYELAPRFSALFSGLDTAHGTGAGMWVKRAPTVEDFVRHLQGQGPGIGIAPLRSDSTVLFAAIDLDEPDFETAFEMQKLIPGTSWVERSRSGNAHVWVFFSEPVEAWVPMGILKETCRAVGKEHTEVFPKNHDFARVRLGNYINLPFHGTRRPILRQAPMLLHPWNLRSWVDEAERTKNDPAKWHDRCRWLLISPPDERERRANFGQQPNLHICAEHVLSGDAGPVIAGHRAVVYFSLAKMLTNWEQVDHEEVLELLRGVNEDSPDPIEDRELRRILANAERGQFTSTGCDDPKFAPYAHPKCSIANPRS